MYGFLDYLTYAILIASHVVILLATVFFSFITACNLRDIRNEKRGDDF